MAIVVMGFFMDVYIASPKAKRSVRTEDQVANRVPHTPIGDQDAAAFGGEGPIPASYFQHMQVSAESFDSGHSLQPLKGTQRVRLSSTADK